MGDSSEPLPPATWLSDALSRPPPPPLQPLLIPSLLFLLQICQANYTKDLLEWVDADCLPEWLGGRSKGTLLDDVGPWSDPEVLRRMEGSLPLAARALKRIAAASGTGDGGAGPGCCMPALLEEPGYYSPRCGLWLWIRLCMCV